MKIEEEYLCILTRFSQIHAKILKSAPISPDFLSFRKDFEQILRSKNAQSVFFVGRKRLFFIFFCVIIKKK